jgi:hypothetical protein
VTAVCGSCEAPVHAENGISDFAVCGVRLIWWEGPQPPTEHYPASTSRPESVTCPACLLPTIGTLNRTAVSPAG